MLDVLNDYFNYNTDSGNEIEVEEKEYPLNFYWKSDQISEVKVYNGTKVNDNISVTASINIARHYPRKIDIDMVQTYNDFKIQNHKMIVSKKWGMLDLVNELKKQSDIGNYVFIPSLYRSEYDKYNGYVDNNGKLQSYVSFDKAKLLLVISNLVCIDIDGANVGPLNAIEKMGKIGKYVAAIIPTPSNGYPNAGQRTYSYRLLFVLKKVTNNPYDYSKTVEGLKLYIAKQLRGRKDLEVDLKMPTSHEQRIRCGKGIYYVNANPLLLDANRMILYYDNVTSPLFEENDNKLKEKVEQLRNKMDGLNDEDLESAYNLADGLKDDFAELVFKQVGRMHKDKDNWLSLCAAMANLCIRGILDLNNVNQYYTQFTSDKEKNNNQITKFYEQNRNKNTRLSGLPTIYKIYETYGGDREDLYITNSYEIKPRDSMRTQFINHFKAQDKNLKRKEIKEKYLKVEIFEKIEEGKHLLEAPTGVGKTDTALKLLKSKKYGKNDDTISIIAVPNVTNVIQLQKHEIAKDFCFSLCPTMFQKQGTNAQNQSFTQAIKRAYINGKRVYCTTYDSVGTIYSILSNDEPLLSLDYLIIDEVHQLTTSYNYRGYACRTLISMMDKAQTVIGMSGTITATNPSLFDTLTIITKKEGNKIPAENFYVMNIDDTLKDEIYKLIKGYIKTRGFKQVLVFVQNKTIQAEVAEILNDNKISYVIANGTNKTINNDVVTMLQDKAIDKSVILSTSVLSDGINLLNDSNKFATVIVSSNSSQIYDAGMIRQMSARYRNNYEELVWLRDKILTEKEDAIEAKKKIRKHKRNIDSIDDNYKYLEKISEKILDKINAMSDKNVQIVRDVIEKDYYIKIDKDNNVEVDKNGLYFRAYLDRVNDSKNKMLTLEKEVEEMLGMTVTDRITSQKLTKEEVEKIEENKKNNKKIEKEKETEFLNNLARILNEHTYNQLFMDDIDNMIEGYDSKKSLSDEQQDFLKDIPEFYKNEIEKNTYLDYDGMIWHLSHVNHNNKNNLFDCFDASLKIMQYKKYGAKSETLDQIKELNTVISNILDSDKNTTKKLEYNLLDSTSGILYNSSTDTIAYTKTGINHFNERVHSALQSQYKKSEIKELIRKYVDMSVSDRVRYTYCVDDSGNIIKKEGNKQIKIGIPSFYNLFDFYEKCKDMNVVTYLTNLSRYCDKYDRHNQSLNKKLWLIANQAKTDQAYNIKRNIRDYLQDFI